MKTFLIFLSCAMLAAAADEPAHPVPAADEALPQGSLYILDSTWTRQDGKPLVWSESTGTARVVALGYATCKGICPRIIADMQRIEQKLEEDAAVRFTFVTLDPENDLEPEMRALADRHKLDPERWDLLRGEQEDLLELAVLLGVKFNRLPNGVDFAHSYLIAVIGPDGKVLHKWTDPKQGPEAAIRALQEVATD